MVKTGLIANDLPHHAAFFVAGATGDLLSSVFYVPSELLKTRLQLQGRYNNPHSLSSHNYKSTWHALKCVYDRYGVPGLYRGWSATLLRDVPFTAFQFTFYESFKMIFKKKESKKSSRITQPHQLTLPQELLSGCMAGMLAGALTTPLDVIKTYSQTQGPQKESFISSHSPKQNEGSNVIAIARRIYAHGGMKAFVHGLGPRVIWTGSQSMIMFFLYEHFVSVLSDFAQN